MTAYVEPLMKRVEPVMQDFSAKTAGKRGEFSRRRLLFAARVDIARSYQITSSRTPWRFYVALVMAAVLYKISTFPPVIVLIWLASIMLMEAVCHLLRAKAIKAKSSRWNIPSLIALHCAVYGSWAVMPTLLLFRSPPESVIGLIVLAGGLASASMTAVQVPITLIGLAPSVMALLAPELADLLSAKPHMSALGVLIIKLLFLLNFASLIRNWHAGIRKEAKLRKDLDESRRKAEALATAKTMFLAHMSHEIRSPLSGVTLMANFLRRLENVPESQRRIVEQIDAGGQAILNLLNTVLDYSKIEEGKVRLSQSSVDVRTLLGNIISLYRLRAQMSDVQLAVSLDNTLPAALMLDENRLRQILTNLVCNAIKFSRGAAVNVFIGYEGGANGTLLVEVRDSGRGVDEEMERRLFKPYEQHRAAEVGAGLGLAICRGLVDLMHGQIGYRRTPGGGATFWVKIPAQISAQSFMLEQSMNVETNIA